MRSMINPAHIAVRYTAATKPIFALGYTLIYALIYMLTCALTFTLTCTLICMWDGEALAKRKRSSKRKRVKLEMNIDLKSLRDEGKSLYNDHKYREAKQVFLQVAQHSASRADDYVPLSWSASEEGDFDLAYFACQSYLELKRSRRGEHHDFCKQVAQNVDLPTLKRIRNQHKERVKETLELITEHKLYQKGSKIQRRIYKLHKQGICDPKFTKIYRALSAELTRALKALIQEVVTDAQAVKALKQSARDQRALISSWGDATWGDRERADHLLEALTLVEELLKHPAERAARLQALSAHPLAEISPETVQLLQLQTLVREGRAVDLYMMSEGIISGLSMSETLSEIESAQLLYSHLLRTIYGALAQDESQRSAAVDSVMRGLELTRDRARRALGIKGAK